MKNIKDYILEFTIPEQYRLNKKQEVDLKKFKSDFEKLPTSLKNKFKYSNPEPYYGAGFGSTGHYFTTNSDLSKEEINIIKKIFKSKNYFTHVGFWFNDSMYSERENNGIYLEL